jgi:hypothetical protein
VKINVLDTVKLEKDFPNYGLQRGDNGAVVEIYEPDGLEVEFVSDSGLTQALITVKVTEVSLVVTYH